MMRTRTNVAVAAALAALALCAGCAGSPTAVLKQIEEAARAGDDAAFASHFTDESAPFARALLSVYRTQAPAGAPPSRPLAILATSTVEGERVEGDRAFLTVKTGEAAPTASTLVFVRESGKWKLDVMQTEKANAGRE
jgi:hypothetical protein